MTSNEELLEAAARDGTLDTAEWPRILETVQSRLNHIVYHEFPIPSIPLPESLLSSVEETPASAPNPDPTLSQNSVTSQFTDKENAPPSSPPTRPPVPAFHAPLASQSQPSQSQRDNFLSALQPPQGTLPPQLLSLHQSIQKILSTQFSSAPPYTIQRLSELVLRPRAHYRFLPAFLNALDRIVSVSSGLNNFPLPPVSTSSAAGSGLINGNNSAIALGSDESLGGALLTPIPWLKNQSTHVNSSNFGNSMLLNGVHTSEGGTVVAHAPPFTLEGPREGGAVTQGELLRQEQEAGLVPTTQFVERHTIGSPMELDPPSEGGSMERGAQFHARGPHEMTVEDMGPQETHRSGALDMEAATGRSLAKSDEPGEADVVTQWPEQGGR